MSALVADYRPRVTEERAHGEGRKEEAPWHRGTSYEGHCAVLPARDSADVGRPHVETCSRSLHVGLYVVSTRGNWAFICMLFLTDIETGFCTHI